jgi:hypothetical protein
MTFEDRNKVFIRAVDLPDQVGHFAVDWIDESPSRVDLEAVRQDLLRLLRRLGESLRSSNSIVFSLEHSSREYPALASVAREVHISPASPMGAQLKRIARDYEREGGRLLSDEEVEKIIAERRGAA